MRVDEMAAARSVEPATILVVDDEEMVRMVVSRMLSEAGYTVLQAGDGAEAVPILKRHAEEVRLIICDLVMPVMTGRDLERVVAARWSHIPMLFISAYPVSYLEDQGLYDGDIALLKKPFLPSRLLEAVEEMLVRSPSST
jgi:two-component system cell cycle sensor histidine kinase/response regulator CckA